MSSKDRNRKIEENYKNVSTEFNDFEGLEELMQKILSLRNSEIYEKTQPAYNQKDPYDSEVDRSKMMRKTIKEIPIYKMANDNLSHLPLNLPYLADLINFNAFSTIHMLIEFLYYREVGRLLTADELKLIDSGRLYGKIVFALDEFDTVSSVPGPTVEFFKRLKEMKWQDKKIKKTFGKMKKVQEQIFYEKWENNSQLGDSDPGKMIQLSLFEEKILLTLAGCSAALDGRTKIVWNDIRTAYKTYFKLLNSDVTKLV